MAPDIEVLVPEPILFNCWKHHLHFLLEKIKAGNFDSDELKKQMKQIGNSTTDLYTGDLTIEDVSNYSQGILKSMGRMEKRSYLDWLKENQDEYQLMEFPDTSVWVFKAGIEPGRHIHIHPGRNVPLTIRVKATILKTAYLANLYALHKMGSPLDIRLINRLRQEILELSPIKFVTMNHELGRMIYFLGKYLGTIN